MNYKNSNYIVLIYQAQCKQNERLLQYKAKEIKPPVCFRKNKNTLEHLRFNINHFHGRVGSANNMVQIKSVNFYAKTENNFYNLTNVPLTNGNKKGN